MVDDVLSSPDELLADELLARAAANDAEQARALVARIGNARLLEVVLTQAQLAVEPDRARPAGIDAIAELDRAAVELMGLTQGVATGLSDGDDLPLVTGWELMTLGHASELIGATSSLPVRPWHLALIAFEDVRPGPLSSAERVVTAVTADDRFVTARLRLDDDGGDDDASVLSAVVTRRLDDLDSDASLAWGLHRALGQAAQDTAFS
jgi:hypothetical protein